MTDDVTDSQYDISPKHVTGSFILTDALKGLRNYTDLPKRSILMNAFLMLSLIIALIFGCFTVTQLTAKLTGYMSAV